MLTVVKEEWFDLLQQEEREIHKRKEAYEARTQLMVDEMAAEIVKGKQLELTFVTYRSKYTNFPDSNYTSCDPDESKGELKRWTEIVELRKIDETGWISPALQVRRPGHYDNHTLVARIKEGIWQGGYSTHGLRQVTHTISTMISVQLLKMELCGRILDELPFSEDVVKRIAAFVV